MAYDPFGDETIFLEPLPDKLQCSVCLRNVQKNPHLTRCCGNHFCQTCIESVQDRGHACPLCKSTRIEIFPNLQQKRDINQLRVRCPLHKENHGECEWKGNFGGLREHVIGHHAEIVLEEEQRREEYVGEQGCYWPPPSTYDPFRDGRHLLVLPRDGGSVVVSPTRMSGYMDDSSFHIITTPGQRPHELLHHRNPTRHQFERPASHHGGHPPLLQQPMYNPLNEHSYHAPLRDDYPGSAGGGGASGTGRGEHSRGSSTSSNLQMLVPPHHSPTHPDDLRCYFGPSRHPTGHGHPPLACPHYSRHRPPPPDPYHLPPPHPHDHGHHHPAPRGPHRPSHCRHGHQHPHPPHHHHHRHPGPR